MTASDWVAPTVALLLIAAFGMTIPRWSDHLPPWVASRVLLATSAVIVATSMVMLAMVALPLLGRADGLADGRWSERVFAHEPAVGWALRAAALVALASAFIRFGAEMRSQRRAVNAARALSRKLGPTAGGVVVVPTDASEALALNGEVILITRGMIRSLDCEQRRAVLAHERAHVRHRHHRYTRAASLLAATNPLLRQLPAAMAYLLERWADEDAADAISRTAVASALERAAQQQRPTARAAGLSVALAAALVAVERRITVLRAQPSPHRQSRVVPPFIVAATASAITVLMAERTMDLFQVAVLLRSTGR